jgi:hypothetical protein
MAARCPHAAPAGFLRYEHYFDHLAGYHPDKRETPRCERHDALLQPEERTESADRFPAGHRAQTALLLAN